MLIDTHCHLNYDYAPKSDSDLVREAGLADVRAMITIGTEMATLAQVAAISDKFENVYHTVGVHPHEAITVQESDYATIKKAASHSKCVAIGEIGLDYHYDHSPPAAQIEVLKRQLAIALECELPVVIHSREAESDLLDALKEYASKLPAGRVPGVIHCFTGTYAFGAECIALGFYVSLSGILTFKSAEDIRTSARAFPLNQLLVETDSPYLAPIPFRGKKCEPSMVKHTAEKLAEVKGLSFDEVARATTENAIRVFGLHLKA